MFHVRYDTNGNQETGFFSLCEATAEDKKFYSIMDQTTPTDHVPWGISSVYDTMEHGPSMSTPEEDEHGFAWVRLEFENSMELQNHANTSPVASEVLPSNGVSMVALNHSGDDKKPLRNGDTFEHKLISPQHQIPLNCQMPLQRETILEDQITISDEGTDSEHRHTKDNFKNSNTENKHDEKLLNLIYGNQKQIFWAVLVRLLLIGHNVLTVWRVVEVKEDNMYWLMTLVNLLLLFELHIVIVRRAGVDFSWWTPCFFIYLSSTIPAIWLLQLQLHDDFVASHSSSAIVPDILTTTPFPTTTTTAIAATGAVTSTTTITPATTQWTTAVTVTTGLITSPITPPTTMPTSTVPPSSALTSTLSVSESLTTTPHVVTVAPLTYQDGSSRVLQLDNTVWTILIQESMVYFLVFSRWLLPRGKVSRAFLADLLLEFLAIASDIMELLAIFQEDEVRMNLELNYVILAVWSASFIQFIPVLMHKRRFKHFRHPRVSCITRYFGDKLVELVVTCMSIFLQDLPFLVVRLYVIFKVQIITYSLIFFVLKNLVTLMLLFYRLTIITRSLCRRSCRNQQT